MAEHLSYSVAKRNNKPIEFDIEGHPLKFTPPKTASMVLPIIEQDDVDDMGVMAMKAQFDWLGDGLGEEGAQYIMDRLKDPKDDFDVLDVEKLNEWIMKQVNGRPTG